MNRMFIFCVAIACIKISCSDKAEKKTIQDPYQFYEYQFELKKEVILKGKIDSYNKLNTIYTKDGNKTDVLVYALIMAHKYNYSRAYYDVFELLYLTGHYVESSENCFDYSLECLDSETKRMALEYLKKAIENGDSTASEILLDYYDINGFYPIRDLYDDKNLVEQARLNRR